ncbi:MAG TPA: sulfatase-like hydrolase/transferase, partial [Anaerolineaceae bacterium]
VDSLIDLFETVHQPLFVHVHMMGTHLPTWDSYDQAVQAFDGYMQEVIGGLQRMNQLDNTMIILYTDHGFTDVTNVRIPLMIRFPDGAHAGVIMHNTQNLDIAPTILDYLGIMPPSWMTGQSLLEGEPPSTRPIFSAAPNYIMANQKNELQLDQSKIGPPFYQFGTIGMVICQNVYTLETASLKWTQSQVQGYPNPCPPGSLPSDRQAQDIMLAQLRTDGFQVGPLEAALAPPAAQ